MGIGVKLNVARATSAASGPASGCQLIAKFPERLGPYRGHRAEKVAQVVERTDGAVLSIRGVEG